MDFTENADIRKPMIQISLFVGDQLQGFYNSPLFTLSQCQCERTAKKLGLERPEGLLQFRRQANQVTAPKPFFKTADQQTDAGFVGSLLHQPGKDDITVGVA